MIRHFDWEKEKTRLRGLGSCAKIKIEVKHIVFFMNILMISLAVVPLVLLFARTQSLKGMGMLFQRLKVFLIILVLVALFNVVLCYDYEIADLHLDELAYRYSV